MPRKVEIYLISSNTAGAQYEPIGASGSRLRSARAGPSSPRRIRRARSADAPALRAGLADGPPRRLAQQQPV